MPKPTPIPNPKIDFLYENYKKTKPNEPISKEDFVLAKEK